MSSLSALSTTLLPTDQMGSPPAYVGSSSSETSSSSTAMETDTEKSYKEAYAEAKSQNDQLKKNIKRLEETEKRLDPTMSRTDDQPCCSVKKVIAVACGIGCCGIGCCCHVLHSFTQHPLVDLNIHAIGALLKRI